MKEYIEREAVIALLECRVPYNGIISETINDTLDITERGVRKIPAADVVERKRGEWVIKNGRIVCDQCEEILAVCPNRDKLNDLLLELKEIEKFCYNCGADMRGDPGADNHD